MTEFNYYLANEVATLQMGMRLSQSLTAGMVVYLYGDLGAGKTTLVRGILRGLNYMSTVKSPSYSMVEAYFLAHLDLYHFDLYRFKSALEWEDSGFDEYCGANSLCLIEWPDKGLPLLPKADIHFILNQQHDGRTLRAIAFTPLGTQSIAELKPC